MILLSIHIELQIQLLLELVSVFKYLLF